MSVALPLVAGAVGQSVASNIAWSIASEYAISTATFDAILGAGFIAGAAIAGAFIAPNLPSTEGPRVMDGMGQVSTYGKFVTIPYGKSRIAGNIIWSKGIREVATVTETGGGKGGGGGGGSSTSYTYYSSWALALCEGKVKEIKRIWFDFDLVYDSEGSTNGNVANKLTFYYGTEDQEVDPTIEAVEGTANSLPYKGICYIVFNDILLSDWHNRIPNITVELTRFPDSGITSEVYPVEMDADSYLITTSYVTGLLKNQIIPYIIPDEAMDFSSAMLGGSLV